MKLPRDWQEFRRERRRELIAQGMPVHLAAEFAAREAKGRMNLAPVLGDNVARNATLVVRSGPGEALSVCLTGTNEALTATARERLSALQRNPAGGMH